MDDDLPKLTNEVAVCKFMNKASGVKSKDGRTLTESLPFNV